MERHELIGMMRELKLAGMRDAYDDVMRAGLQHQRGATEILGDLLKAELTEKTARSIRYQTSAAKFPVTKTLAEFDFDGRPSRRHRFKPDGRPGQRGAGAQSPRRRLP